MERISEIFKAKKPLIVFTEAGFPTIAESEKAIDLAIQNGADVIELGVPFSDPMADGPVIAAASQKLAAEGVGLTDVISLADRIRIQHPSAGLILFSYMNPMLHYGYEKLCAELKDAGVDGILPVDLPLEERDELLQITRRNGLHLIPLVSPLTPPKRIREITEGMTGFVYYINVAGVTGVRRNLPADYPDLMRQVKKLTTLPVASGFGIADAETAKAAAQYADGVITGSGFIKALEVGTEYAADFVSKLSDGMKTH